MEMQLFKGREKVPHTPHGMGFRSSDRWERTGCSLVYKDKEEALSHSPFIFSIIFNLLSVVTVTSSTSNA